MSWNLSNTARYFSSGASLVRKEVVPLEFRPFHLVRKELTPIDWRQFFLRRKERVPFEWPTNLELFRKEHVPIEWTGQASGLLLVKWNVTAKLNVPLVVQWNVLSSPPLASLTVQWNVMDALAVLTVTWNVIPNVQAQFNQDVQKPSASIG